MHNYSCIHPTLLNVDVFVTQMVVMPTVSEYPAYQEASPEAQENMTYYYNSSFSLRIWSANSEAGSAALSPVFGEIFGEGQSKAFCLINTYLKGVLHGATK